MLGGMALLWRWRARRKAAAKTPRRPNLVMGSNVQVCWEKFCRYWDVEPRYVPVVPGRYHLGAAEAVALCDENTIGVVVIIGSTMDGSYEPVARPERRARRARGHAGRPRRADPRGRRVRRVRRAVPAAGAGVGLPGAARRVDQHLRAQVRPGLPRRRLDRLARRRRAARGPDLQGQLPRRGDADVRAELLPARRAGRRAVLQLPAARLHRLPARAADLPGHRRGTCPARSASSARSSCCPTAATCRYSRSSCATTSTGTRCSTSRSGCGCAAGRCPPTRSPRT